MKLMDWQFLVLKAPAIFLNVCLKNKYSKNKMFTILSLKQTKFHK